MPGYHQQLIENNNQNDKTWNAKKNIISTVLRLRLYVNTAVNFFLKPETDRAEGNITINLVSAPEEIQNIGLENRIPVRYF